MNTAALRSRAREYFDAAIEQWIGFSFPPVHRAIEDAQWQPDDPQSYCHQCGDSVGEGEVTDAGCATCREGAELAGGIGQGVLRLGPYEGTLQHWVTAIKFSRWAEMGERLGNCLGRVVCDANVVDAAQAIVVPMPMPWQRRVYRGIDHSRVIASGVAKVIGAPIVSILAKGHQPPQVSLPVGERKRRGSRGLRIRRRIGGWPVQGAHLVLVDDVRTTGASLRAATRLLKTLKPQKIICAVIAVSDSKARRRRAEQANALRQVESDLYAAENRSSAGS